MDERFEDVRQQLLKQKQEIVRKFHDKKDDHDKQGGDFIDIATDSLEHELNYIFEERDRGKLQSINAALKLMQEGGYGECDDCGEDIDIDRLVALPFTRLCLDCKSKQERQKKLRVYTTQES
ncbi:MAG: TraR/DksA family transcriptional regulator [bacterium]|nr:TraR/DksA family transcriptional regulator [bacterium]